jgi:DNA-binding beta-propeller fold protein YncE
MNSTLQKLFGDSRKWGRSVSTVAVTAALLLSHSPVWADDDDDRRPVGHFVPVASLEVGGAEIVAATFGGHLLIYTDAENSQIGFVDLRQPASPQLLGTMAVDGEPTAVAVTPNGRWILVVVSGEVDQLAVFDAFRLDQPPVIKLLGGQPDSVAVSPDGRYAAIAIENERDEEVEEGALPQEPAGFLTTVDLVGAPANWTLRDVSLSGIADRFGEDPESEFVDINAANRAAVTLQENNHVVIVDLPSGTIAGDFPAGTVTHAADLDDDKQIVFDDMLVDARREPDAIGWTPNGNLVTANEGDYDLDVDFVGGRGFTIFSPLGEVLYDSGADLELALVAAGRYDDSRSDAKGTEPEGIEVGVFNNHTFVFVGMERAGAVAVYRLNGRKDQPKLIQILETGSRPEGLLAIPNRNLFVTANEGDGTLSIFAGQPGNPR